MQAPHAVSVERHAALTQSISHGDLFDTLLSLAQQQQQQQ